MGLKYASGDSENLMNTLIRNLDASSSDLADELPKLPQFSLGW